MSEIKLYSIYDLQSKQIDSMCNLMDMNEAIQNIRDYADDDHDTTNILDNDLFINWEFILFEHDQQVDYPFNVDFEELLKSIPNIKIIYPCYGQSSLNHW